MAHKRFAIVNYIADILLLNIPAFAGMVFAGRHYVINESELPACVINIDSEQSELGTTMINPRLSERVLSVKIDIYVRGHDDIAEELSALSSAIEIAMALDTTLNDLAVDSMLANYDEELSGNQNSSATAYKTGYAELLFLIKYDVPENNPEV